MSSKRCKDISSGYVRAAGRLPATDGNAHSLSLSLSYPRQDTFAVGLAVLMIAMLIQALVSGLQIVLGNIPEPVKRAYMPSRSSGYGAVPTEDSPTIDSSK